VVRAESARVRQRAQISLDVRQIALRRITASEGLFGVTKPTLD
jgi:hypothetical protein